ncbi:MAG: histone deacetylase [Hyphomicrobiaceae bacterium]|nr:histone deacetylase [Hyphomicrobiaceae bacterium]
MPFYFPDTPDLPLPPGHRFPGTKYRMLRERAQSEGVFEWAGLVPSPEVQISDLLRAHDESYVRDAIAGRLTPDAMRRIGIPWSEVLIARSLATVGGSLAAARDALNDGISGQLAGGTHHAHRAFGSGFCLFNDLAVAALTLIAEGEVSRITVLDCDVHQGDGTAAILRDVAEVQTISIHGASNFPFRKVPSDLDIGLPDGAGDKDYAAALAQALDVAAAFRPDLLLYLSGADVLADDRLGRLELSPAGMMARDLAVFRFAKSHGLPVSIAIGGGYAEPITVTVEAYLATFRAAQEVYRF